ncbi:MAG: type IV pilus secretin PilQ [Syntrophorhabdaceae bacterium]|nr:type IV pilus secretin PilQ [Syntrophorhabdaceae bacterium]
MNTLFRLSGHIFRQCVLYAVVALIYLLAVSSVSASEAGGKVKEIVISKTPYNTTIQAVIDGPIESFMPFKMEDPFRIVLDIKGVAQDTVASDIPVDTPQVKGVKVSSQDGKVRIIVETTDNKPLPYMTNTFEGGLSLTVGGGGPAKVSSTDRFQGGKTPSGVAVVGIDLEDQPDVANVVVTTSSTPDYRISRSGNTVTMTFPGASAQKSLLRRIDAQKLNVPVRSIVPSATGGGISVAVSFEAGATYTVDKKDNAVVLAFAKGEMSPASELVARAAPKEQLGRLDGGPRRAAAGPKAPGRVAAANTEKDVSQWGFLTRAGSPERVYTGQRISLDFKDAELTNIFRIMAEVSNLNIITTDDVKGRVTVRLVNVPWDQALDIILRSKALGATQEGNILRIAPMAVIQREEQERFNAQKIIEIAKAEAIAREEETRTLKDGVIEIIPVSFSKASDLLEKIKPQASRYGVVDSDDRTNVLIVRDLPQNIERVRDLVSRLDLSTPQVLIEARIVEIDTSYTRELGVQWGGQSGKSNGSTSFGITGTQNPLGQRLNPPSGVIPYNQPNYAVNLPAATGIGSGGGIAFGFMRNNVRLDLSLSALESSGKAKIISSPKVVTVDNKEALIEQGTQIPYSTVSASGTNTQFIDAVLSLKVTPHITPDGRIAMQLEAKNDSQGEISATGQPAINKKKATTEVLIGDGETTVIGGILQVIKIEDYAGVPWLSKIPFLGILFRKDMNSAQNRELLIFITPKILKGDEPSVAKAF